MSTSVSSLEPEWSILLAACSLVVSGQDVTRFSSSLSSSVRWKLLFDLAERHGVQPLLFHALRPLAEAVPSNEMRFLGQVHQTNLHKAMLLSRELIRIVRCLSEFEIEHMPYKGLALAEALYGDIALRQAGDIDLLIRDEHWQRVPEALARIGYSPKVALSESEERAYRKSGYECVFDGPAGRNVLEVQWAFQPRFYSVDFDLPAIFARAVDATVAGQPMKTPSLADQMLTLSAHAAKHAWGRLIWLCDIARLMSFHDLDWNWISSQAVSLGISRMIGVSMLLANRLLGAEIPSTAQGNLAADRSAKHLTDEVQSRISNTSDFNLESLSYFRLMLRLRERASDRLRFVSRLALTPGPGEWQTVRLPSALFPLYRLIRIGRLAGRMVGA